MNRVVVVGSSGSGKTTVSRALADALDLPHLELDSVFHRGGWSSTPDDEFRARAAEFTARPGWVVDGNYTSHGMRETVWPHADTFVWLDLPKRTIMRRVVSRTLRRVITREELWDGVTEPWTNLYSLDPEDNIIVWAWTRFDHIRKKYEAATADGSWDHANVHRLTGSRSVRSFVQSVSESRTAAS